MACEAGHGQFVTRESDEWHICNPIAPVYLWFKPLYRQWPYLNSPEEKQCRNLSIRLARRLRMKSKCFLVFTNAANLFVARCPWRLRSSRLKPSRRETFSHKRVNQLLSAQPTSWRGMNFLNRRFRWRNS